MEGAAPTDSQHTVCKHAYRNLLALAVLQITSQQVSSSCSAVTDRSSGELCNFLA